MRTIEFSVNQQKIKNNNSVSHLYKGTNNYLKLKFIFSEDWNDCAKVIYLSDKKIPIKLDQNDCCIVPDYAFDENHLSFYLIGNKNNYRVESQKFQIKLAS